MSSETSKTTAQSLTFDIASVKCKARPHAPFVAPEARRSGAGKQLLQSAEQLAAKNGMARMDLTTARTNLPAQAAYEALGWVRDEVFCAYSKHVGI